MTRRITLANELRPDDALGILRERGFIQQISDEQGLATLLQQPSTVYWGVDPTSSSLQVGNLLSLMLLANLKRCGHRPIVVMGGGTGLIGDPSFRTSERPLLSQEQILANLEGQRQQIASYFGDTPGEWYMLNNADWLEALTFVDFLRDFGRHFTVGQLLQHETYRQRVPGVGSASDSLADRREEGLSLIEFNYALLQAYDFYHLSCEYDCFVQVGGSDQWFNILAGVDLIRRLRRRDAFALVTPLITTAAGNKMGKSASGTVWLDPERTPPFDYYQFWLNTDDADVERFLGLFTFLDMAEVRELGASVAGNRRRAKEVLAFEATRLTHGEAIAIEARNSSNSMSQARD